MGTPEYAFTRREPRARASGGILIEVVPGGDVVHGNLLDVSPHGFAIHHDYLDFLPGQQVHVVYQWGKVRARVVWSRERDGKLAAGFRTD